MRRYKMQDTLTRNAARVTRNEKGIALVTVLVLSFICLAITATLIYLVTQGTKFSGFYKRYETAREAAGGGAEIAAAVISKQGELDIPDIIGPLLRCDSSASTVTDLDTCLCRKLLFPPYTGGTYNWGVEGAGACAANGASLNPLESPDFEFPLAGFGTDYQVSAKIIDTTIGVTDMSGEDLGCGSGVAYSCGTFQGPPTPFLYRVEINSQDAARPIERSRLSVLYAF